MDIHETLNLYTEKGKLSKKLAGCLQKFFTSYREAVEKNSNNNADYQPLLSQFLEFILEELESPSKFEAYHQRITAPINYYQFGLDFIRPLVNFSESRLYHEDQVIKIAKQLSQRENVILLANHQTEPDPQAIALMLEKKYPEIAQQMIFFAGHRVISDPLAIPFSKGCNLLCIFSKKYIENPPEKKLEKLLHNKKTMHILSSLLSEGGKIIYVAPSGGRDRPNEQGTVEVAPFDPQSIEMFRLIAQQSLRPSHFYPLALGTYDLLPPPSSIENELGERRHAQCSPIHLSFGSEIDMDHFQGSDSSDKHELRRKRAEYIQNLVVKEYNSFFNGF